MTTKISKVTQSPLQKILIFLVAILSIALQYPQPKLDLDYYTELAANYTSTSPANNDPLKGITVVVTGPTSGLGLGATKALYGMGATIIAVGRSRKKLSNLSEQLGEGDGVKDGERRLIPIVADFQDLDSVASAASEIESKFEKIDFLVNNAGISHGDAATPQGFDLVFGVNYLSPFLLTERLLPILEKSTMKNNPRIIQISSTMHFTVSGSSLIPSSSDSSDLTSSSPAASQLNPSKMHGWQSYSTSKLAQIYHMRSLSRELKDKKSPVKVVSLCPSWVATKIAGDNTKLLLQLFAYDSDGFGIAPFLYAMFHPLAGVVGGDEKVNDYVTNCSYMCNSIIAKIVGKISKKIDKSDNLRNLLLSSFAPLAMVAQKPFSSVAFRESSDDSFNVDYQNQLFKWTRDTIAPWINKEKEKETIISE